MTGSDEHSEIASHELSDEGLDQAVGGMKWERNTQNPDVIDARGGSYNCILFSITLDKSGNISSFGPPK